MVGRIRWFIIGAATATVALILGAFVVVSMRSDANGPPPPASALQGQIMRERRVRSSLLEALVQRARVEVGEEDRADLDLLLLSGGAQYGAFAAGILGGWAASEEVPRPHFDLVTGVSAGAMLATSAFIDRGDVYGSEVVERLFVRARDAWSLEHPMAYLPWRSSLLSPKPLSRAIDESTPHEAIDRVGEEAREGRRLLVMTTDVELGRPTAWDLTTLAAKTEVDRYAAYRRRILASASVPPMFPPVKIDGSLHVDGGASHIFFLGPRADLLDDLYQRLHGQGLASKTRIRVWVIVSSPIWPVVDAVPRRWPAVTYRFGALGTYALARADLQRIHRAVERLASQKLESAEFRFMAVPTELSRQSTLASPEFVRNLQETGRRLGRRGEWSRELPMDAD